MTKESSIATSSPENIFLLKDGRVKILDFGLAKLLQVEAPEPAAAKTATALTQAGMVMGTIGYMAPEQVRAESTDHRLDLFTFGIILLEMLTGRRAFLRGSAVESMNAILQDDPTEGLEANPSLSPTMIRIVRRCLEKARERRFQSAHDLAFALESLAAGAPTVAVRAPVRPRAWLQPLLAGLILLVAAGAAYWIGSRAGGRSAPLSFQPLTFRHGTITTARFATEGQTVLYSASWDGGPVELYSTRPDSPESRSLNVSGTELLGISASGEMALLRKGGTLLQWTSRFGVLAQAPLAGGAPREILEDVLFADWAPDGKLAVVRGAQGRFRVEFPIGKLLCGTSDRIGALRISPKGDLVAIAERPPGYGTDWAIVTVDGNGKKNALSRGWTGESLLWLAWRPAGDEIWFMAGIYGGDTLRAVSLSGKLRELARFPVPFQLLDVSRDGRLLMNRATWRGGFVGVPPGETKERELAWLDASEIDDLSHDTKTMLLTEFGEGGGTARWSVYLRKLDGSPAVRLGEGGAFALSPDGKWAITLRRSNPPQLVLLPTGPGTPVALERGSVGDFLMADWLPDGKRILVSGSEPGRIARCYLQDVSGGPPRPVSAEGVFLRLGQHTISPDGAWFTATDAQGKVSLSIPPARRGLRLL